MSKNEANVKKCKHCQTEIDAKAKVCPNCRKKQGMSLGVKIVIGVIILFVLVGMFGGSEEPTSSSNNGENKTNEEKKTTFNQDETVDFKGVKFTVTNVLKHTKAKYDEPKEGYEFIEVTIKIENTSNEKYSYDPYSWKMENSQGQELDGSSLYLKNIDDGLDSADLNPGGTVTGKLGFEQPKGDTGLYLNYYDNMFDDNYSFQIKIN